MNKLGSFPTLFVVPFLLCQGLIAQSSPNDWPGFLGPGRDSKSPQKHISKDWSDGKLRLVWQHKIGESYAAPSIAGKEVYLFDRVRNENVLKRLSSEDGKEIWRYSYETDYRDMYGYNNGPRCSPIIHGNQIIIYGSEGELHCLDRKSGEKIWSVDTAKKYGVVQNFFGVGSSPVVFKDLLICMVGGSPDESQSLPQGRLDLAKPNKSAVVAFRLEDGKEQYRVGNDLASYASMAVRKINGKPVGLAFCRSGLIGFEPSNGKQLFDFPWRARSLESVNASTPIVFSKNKIFLSECYSIGSVLLEWNGEKLDVVWKDGRGREQKMMTHWNTPIEFEGSIYGSSGRHSRDAELRCIDAMSGDVKWIKKGLSRSTLTWVDGHFVLLTEYGRLMLIKVNDEKFEFVTEFEPKDESVKLRYPCWAAPVIANGKMYVLSNDALFCFQLGKQPD